MENMQVSTPKKSKVGLIIALVVVLAVIVVLCVILFGKGYENVLEENIEILNKHEVSSKEIEALENIGGLSEAYETFNMLLDLDTENAYKASIEVLEDKFGEDYKVTYDIKEATKLKRSEREKVKEGLVESMDEMRAFMDMMSADTDLYATYFSVEEGEIKDAVSAMNKAFDAIEDSKLTTAYKATLKLGIIGEKDKKEFECEIVFAKIDGEWRMLVEENEVYNTFTVNPDLIVEKTAE